MYAGVWVAVGELPAKKQRIARAAIAAATLAGGAVIEKIKQGGAGEQSSAQPDQKSGAEASDSQQEPQEAEGSMSEQDQRRLTKNLVLTAATGTVLSIARRQLRKRWLTGLAAEGHPHPHRALAIRMSALTFVLSLARHLLSAVESRRESKTSRPQS